MVDDRPSAARASKACSKNLHLNLTSYINDRAPTSEVLFQAAHNMSRGMADAPGQRPPTPNPLAEEKVCRLEAVEGSDRKGEGHLLAGTATEQIADSYAASFAGDMDNMDLDASDTRGPRDSLPPPPDLGLPGHDVPQMVLRPSERHSVVVGGETVPPTNVLRSRPHHPHVRPERYRYRQPALTYRLGLAIHIAALLALVFIVVLSAYFVMRAIHSQAVQDRYRLMSTIIPGVPTYPTVDPESVRSLFEPHNPKPWSGQQDPIAYAHQQSDQPKTNPGPLNSPSLVDAYIPQASELRWRRQFSLAEVCGSAWLVYLLTLRPENYYWTRAQGMEPMYRHSRDRLLQPLDAPGVCAKETMGFTLRITPTWPSECQARYDKLFQKLEDWHPATRNVSMVSTMVWNAFRDSFTQATYRDAYRAKPCIPAFEGIQSDTCYAQWVLWKALYQPYDLARDKILEPPACNPLGHTRIPFSTKCFRLWQKYSESVAPAKLRKDSIGCYKDEHGVNRLLPYRRKPDYQNTPGRCVQYCYDAKYAYAGVKHGKECFCGDNPPSEQALDARNCNLACAGDRQQKCGGRNYIEVYSTKGLGLRRRPQLARYTVQCELPHTDAFLRSYPLKCGNVRQEGKLPPHHPALQCAIPEPVIQPLQVRDGTERMSDLWWKNIGRRWGFTDRVGCMTDQMPCEIQWYRFFLARHFLPKHTYADRYMVPNCSEPKDLCVFKGHEECQNTWQRWYEWFSPRRYSYLSAIGWTESKYSTYYPRFLYIHTPYCTPTGRIPAGAPLDWIHYLMNREIAHLKYQTTGSSIQLGLAEPTTLLTQEQLLTVPVGKDCWSDWDAWQRLFENTTADEVRNPFLLLRDPPCGRQTVEPLAGTDDIKELATVVFDSG